MMPIGNSKERVITSFRRVIPSYLFRRYMGVENDSSLDSIRKAVISKLAFCAILGQVFYVGLWYTLKPQTFPMQLP